MQLNRHDDSRQDMTGVVTRDFNDTIYSIGAQYEFWLCKEREARFIGINRGNTPAEPCSWISIEYMRRLRNRQQTFPWIIKKLDSPLTRPGWALSNT